MEIVSILALFIGVLGSLKFLHVAMNFLDNNFEINGTILPYVAFIMLFVGILLVVIASGKFIKKLVDYTLLGSADNIAGAFVGLLKWGLFLSLGLMLLEFLHYTLPADWTESSVLYSSVKNVVPWTMDVISPVLPFAQNLLDEIFEILDSGKP